MDVTLKIFYIMIIYDACWIMILIYDFDMMITLIDSLTYCVYYNMICYILIVWVLYLSMMIDLDACLISFSYPCLS